MKKILLGTAAVFAIATVQTAQAQSAYDDTTISPYIGAYGGYGWTDAETSAVGGDVKPEGGDYGLYAGFQADSLLDNTVNQTGLALSGAVEFHYGWSGADESVGGVSFEKENEWGVSFRPGLSFLNSDTFNVTPYGIIGYRQTEYEVSVGGASAEEDYDGFELGVGTELAAYDNVGVRLDYTHVWYGEENGFDPDEDNIRLGLGYRF